MLPTPTTLFDLTGKTALVTGASRGIGRAAAEVLAGAGAHVTLAARTSKDIEAVAEHIRAHGGSAETVTADLLDLDQINALAARGPFNILLNNAGMNRPQTFTDVDVETYDAIFELNVRSAFFMAQAVVKGLLAAGQKGSLVHISSQMGHIGGKRRTVYCASKHAMEGFSKAMALDLAEHGIRSNTVCPTFIRTPLTAPYFEDESFMADTLNKIPLGRIGEVEDLMGAVLYLASDASSLVTGSSLMVDGGWTAQ
ncbi:MAG: SDR family oxidoreductase [Alphaproteobacteria bacterium TMED89]|nr:3-oxoacyl-ACP reductase [Rhodospirillaceae bacterium]RPH18822.1 MAG: SDR family oxidoreductase [Alphaproteobacteria bacterium TMED89]